MDPTTHTHNSNGNGTLTKTKKKKKKRTHSFIHPPPSLSPSFVYRECLKNHAASLGGHALDGCCEFMPSPSSNPTDPSSLTCAACSCHRNFHRRYSLQNEFQQDQDQQVNHHNANDDVEEEEYHHEEDDVSSSGRAHSTTPPHTAATHMLLALSTGYPSSGEGPTQQQQQQQKKRFRTKFSQEQKEKMQELSERVGWRMQRRDDAVVEVACREIGVERGVFKVWMHNNKHIFTKKPSTTPSASTNGTTNGANGGADGAGTGIGNLEMKFNGSVSSS